MLALLVHLAAASPTIGILPVAREEITFDDATPTQRLDKALRKAAAATAGVTLQDLDTTKANIAAAASAGVVCSGGDAACLGHLAVLAQVDRLLVPVARAKGVGFHVRIRGVDTDGRFHDVEADVPLEPDDALRDAARKLVADAVDPAVASTMAAPPAPAPAPTPAPPAAAPAPTPPAPAAASTGGDVAARALAVGGAVAALGAGIGVVVVEASLAKPELYSARQPKQEIGVALLVVTGAGIAAAGVGAALLFAAP